MQAVLCTYEDYLKINDDNQYEIIGGKLIMVPAPRTMHQRVKGNIFWFLKDYIRKNDLGVILDAPTDVILSETEKPQPDILFVSKERLDIITEQNVQGAPDLVIEILSPSTAKYDRTEKSRAYYNHGVKEYWIVDPDIMCIEIFVSGESNWNLYKAFSINDVLTSSVLVAFYVEVKELFE